MQSFDLQFTISDLRCGMIELFIDFDAIYIFFHLHFRFQHRRGVKRFDVKGGNEL